MTENDKNLARILFYEGRVAGGYVRVGGDLMAAAFFTREQIDAGGIHLTDLTADVLRSTGWLG